MTKAPAYSVTPGNGDIENQIVGENGDTLDSKQPISRATSIGHDGPIPGETFHVRPGRFDAIKRLASRLHLEQRGIQRVPEDERHETGKWALLNVATLWLSANMVTSTFAIGLLSQTLFGLSAADSMLTVVFFNLLAVLPVCFFSMFGPRFGLRQIVLSRYWFGWWGVKIVATLNALSMIGWAAVNTIVGAQLIHAVNNDVPGFAGVLIVASATLIVCMLGYKVVHSYELYSWIPAFIVFLIVLGVFAHDGDFRSLPMGVGTSEMGNVLSFGSAVFGYAVGWATYATDYTVYHPATRSRGKVFLWTWLGLIVPVLFTELLAVAVATAIPTNGGDNRYKSGYDESGIGGILAAVLVYHLGTFGKFCLVVLALSAIGCNCPNIYSMGLVVQSLARCFLRVPRFLWSLIGTCVYVAIAIPGYASFQEVLQNFLTMIGYWIAIYTAIALTDHLVWKRGMDGYDVTLHDRPEKLPLGLAAIFSFLCGVAGMVTGMSQTWYVGPIALKAGLPPFGGDVGFELAFGFTVVAYLITRPLELRVFER